MIPGKKSKWKGFDRSDFVSAGRQATVVVTKKSAYGRPWIWRPVFWGLFSNVDVALLNEGFHVVYYDLTHLYGSPRSLMFGDVFYNRMVKGFKSLRSYSS